MVLNLRNEEYAELCAFYSRGKFSALDNVVLTKDLCASEFPVQGLVNVRAESTSE